MMFQAFARRLVSRWWMVAPALIATVSPALAQPVRSKLEMLPLRQVAGDVAQIAARPSLVATRALVCGTLVPAHADIEGIEATLGRWRDEHLDGPAGGTIRVAFHIITANGEGEVSDPQLADQVRELNRIYAATGYRFELSSVDRTEAPNWFRMTPASDRERKAKEALALDPARHLNVYACGLSPGLSGWASLPWSAPEGASQQGVVITSAALAGGPASIDLAGALAHQVGHYLGLLHGEGGEISLARPGAEQVGRVRAIVPVYRPSLFTEAPPAGAPGKPEISPAAGAEPEDGRVLSYRGAFPNPFRVETALRFTLPSSGPVSLRIYSVTGQLVRTLVDATLPPGDHSAMFRAEGLPSGAYFAVLRAGSVQMSRTLMLIR